VLAPKKNHLISYDEEICSLVKSLIKGSRKKVRKRSKREGKKRIEKQNNDLIIKTRGRS